MRQVSTLSHVLPSRIGTFAGSVDHRRAVCSSAVSGHILTPQLSPNEVSAVQCNKQVPKASRYPPAQTQGCLF